MWVRVLYSILWGILWPLLMLRLLWKSRELPAYRARLPERLGFYKQAIPPNGIWLHTVSVGEFLAAKPFILALLQQYPNHALTITTVTPTGSELVQQFIAEQQEQGCQQMFHVYVPYDMPGPVRRFLACVRPKIALIFETELWLNVLSACQKKQIPVLLLNARLSERSANKYARFPKFTQLLLKQVTAIAVQFKADADRFKKLGYPAEQLLTTGSVKFDLDIKASDREAGRLLRRQLGQDRPVWIVASTHEGEEAQILKILPKLNENIPNLCTILVPRHPNRFDKVAALCANAGFEFVRRSETKGQDITVKSLYLADTLGEMMSLFAASDVAFVAGSFQPIGGHNVIEPIALGVPTVVGPHMFNFATISDLLLAEGGMCQVATAEELTDAVSHLFADSQQQQSLREAGFRVLATQQGVLEKMTGMVNAYFPKSS